MEKNKNIWVIPTDKPSRLIFNKSHQSFCLQKEPEGMYINDGKVRGADFWGIEKANNNGFNPQHIYITSYEDINENDYIITKDGRLVQVSYLLSKDLEGASKVILTTDQDLIKDGVQSIPDEFLEWFVKNPSCEGVDVYNDKSVGYEYDHYSIIIPKKNFYCGDKFDYDEQCLEQCDTCVDKKGVDYGYLPKEEPKKVLTEEDIFNQKDIDAVTDYINKEQQKQALIDMMKSDEELGLYDDIEINRIELICRDCSDSLEDCTCIKSTVDFPKQEIKLEDIFNDDKRENIKKFIDEIQNPSEPNQALKDAAERLYPIYNRFKYDEDWVEDVTKRRDDFTEGAKWQQERSYSEEEVIAFGEFIFKHSLLAHSKGVKNLFEQFKNK